MKRSTRAIRETAPIYGASLEPSVLDDLVARVVRAVAPDRIVMFGSGARGTMSWDSDVDLLVIKSGAYRRIDVMQDIRRNLRGLGVAVDLVVATPEEIERYKHSPALIYGRALAEGREVYAASR